MWKYRGQSAYRSENRFTAKLASFERLEYRCVLNAGPTSKAYDDPSLLDGKFDGNSAVVGNPQDTNHAASNPASQFGDKFHGQDPMLLGSRVVSSPYSGSLSPAEYIAVVSSYLAISPSNASVMIIVTALPSTGAGSFYAVTAYAIPYFDNIGSPADNSHDGNSKGNGGGVSHPTMVPVAGAGAIAAQLSEVTSHATLPDPANTAAAAMVGQPSTAKMPTPTGTNQAAAETIHNTGFWYSSGAIQQVHSVIVEDATIVQNLFAANFDAAGGSGQPTGNLKSAQQKQLPAADTSNWPVNKASLVALPLNTKGVQQALDKVMGELGRLGTAFGTWLDAQHLTAAAAVVTVVTIGGGTAVYLRRRGGKHAQKRDEEEASSSWLFAHLQSAPDVT